MIQIECCAFVGLRPVVMPKNLVPLSRPVKTKTGGGDLRLQDSCRSLIGLSSYHSMFLLARVAALL